MAEDASSKSDNEAKQPLTENGEIRITPLDEFIPQDGGWGWIVCLTSFCVNGTVFGIINTFGIVYVKMREHYAKDDPEVSLKADSEGKTTQDANAFNPPDGGWGWVVCISSLIVNGTVMGIINTFGIVYVKMREHYAKNDPEVSLKAAFVGSVCTGVTFFMCIFASISSDRFGIRQTAVVGATLGCAGLLSSAFIEKMELLYLTYGVLLGVGSALVYSPSLVILGHYFRRHMGLVNGIVSFGSSIFTIALTRVLPILLETVDIKYTFICLSGLHFLLILFSLTWKPLFTRKSNLARLALSTESVYQHCNDCCTFTKKFLNVKIWKSRAYVLWTVSLGVGLLGYFVSFFHLPQYTKDNFPDEDGSLLILCLSITSGVSRIVFGKVADLRGVNRVQMQQASFFVLGICTLCIPFSASFGGLIAISLVMGICDGIFVCLLGPIAFDIVGRKEANQAIGFLLGTFSIPFTVGPPVAGYLYDLMGNYRVAFHVAGAPPILGAILMFFIPRVKQNFPGVTTSQEFASISKLDIYSSTTQEGKMSKTQKTSTTSGPSSEIVVIQASDILNFGPTSQVSEPDVERQAMLSEDDDVPDSQHNESIAKDKKSTDNGYYEESKE